MEFQCNIYEQLDIDAMQVLIDYCMCDIPIDVFTLAKKLNIKLIKFSGLTKKQRDAFGDLQIVSIKISKSKYDYKIHVYYDDKIPMNRQRFNISHEIKHVIYEEWEYDEEQERHANHFARSLLLHPTILICLAKIDIHSISSNFGISEESVSYAVETIDKRILFYNHKLFGLEIEFIKKFANKELFDKTVLKLNNIIR